MRREGNDGIVDKGERERRKWKRRRNSHKETDGEKIIIPNR